jgi:hypothetical protein
MHSVVYTYRLLLAVALVAMFISFSSWADSLCEAGSYGADDSADCTLAPEGSFVAQPGATSALECPVGSYADAEGLSACIQAPRGSFIDSLGAISPRLCPIGSYNNALGSSSCTLAPIGSFVPTTGATNANFCLLGTVTRVLGASTCVKAIYGELNFDEVHYTVVENNYSLTLNVNRTNGSDGQISVDYRLQDGSAIAVKDYIYTAGTLTFLNGEKNKTITLSVVDNSVFSSDKLLTVSLNNAASETKAKGILGAKSVAKVTIINDDAAPAEGVIGFEFPAQTAQEDSTNVLIDIVRTGGTTGPLSVNYLTQDITPMAGQKYEAVSGILRFLNGETRKTLSIRIIDNEVYQRPEKFLIKLINTQGNALFATASTEITIVDKKPVPATGLLEIQTSQYVVNENDSALAIQVNRVGGAQGEASVDVSLQGSSNIIDGAKTVLSFAENELQKTFTLNLTDNQIFQGDQTFTLVLSNASGALLGTQTSTIVKIMDDEPAPAAGILRLSGTAYNFSENADKFPITITRSNGSLGEASVRLSTKDGTAISRKDYLAEDTKITLANGELSKTINLVILEDTLYTGPRTFSVELSATSDSAFIAQPSSATVTIDEDDPTPPAGILQFANTAYSVNEAGKTVTLTIIRTGGSFGNASVNYKLIDETALRGQDIIGGDGTLYFSDGETTKALVFDILDDKLIEQTESLSVTLSNPTQAILGTPTKIQLSILDDDVATVEAPKKKSKGGAMSVWMLLAASLGFMLNIFRGDRFKK